MPTPLPTGLSASADLTAGDVRSLLADHAEELTDRLGITDPDRHELLALLPGVLADEELLAEIVRWASALRREAGLRAPVVPIAEDSARLDALQQRIAPGEGLLAILAHLVSTDTVRAWHAARGVPEDVTHASLADLGQQMSVHRRSSGRLGLHQTGWTAMIWTGRLLSLGRLQFELHQVGQHEASELEPDVAEPRWILGVHIPATGPLAPGAVDASFEQASELVPDLFPDLALGRPADAPAWGREFDCDSWLVHPELPDLLGEDSNIGSFAARWQILRSGEPGGGADAAAFFVFGARPPYDAAALPQRSRLERAVGERLADGRGWSIGYGVAVRD